MEARPSLSPPPPFPPPRLSPPPSPPPGRTGADRPSPQRFGRVVRRGRRPVWANLGVGFKGAACDSREKSRGRPPPIPGGGRPPSRKTWAGRARAGWANPGSVGSAFSPRTFGRVVRGPGGQAWKWPSPIAAHRVSGCVGSAFAAEPLEYRGGQGRERAGGRAGGRAGKRARESESGSWRKPLNA